MVKVETAALEEVVRTTREGGFLAAIGGPQFLAAQFFTIIATILGVYLAGYVGFQRTLEYDRYVKAQQKSDLLTATREELKNNIARMQKFNERLPAEVGTGLSNTEWPRLRMFVWQAVGRSSSAFDMPPQILTDMQAFYEDMGDMLNDAEARQSFKSLTTSNTYFRTQFKERFNSQLKFAESSILPALSQTAAEADKLVTKYSNAGEASH